MIIKMLRGGPAALFVFAFLFLTAGTVRAQSLGSSDSDKRFSSPFASFRFGYVASPIGSANVGMDVTFPRLSIGASWVTRFDLDLTAHLRSVSFGSRRDAEVYPMFSLVYTPGGVNCGRYFAGAGLGLVFGPHSGLAGKIFAGINLTQVVSLEFEGRAPGDGTTRAAVMVRLSAL